MTDKLLLVIDELIARIARLEARVAEFEDGYYVPPKRKPGPPLPPDTDENAWLKLGRTKLPRE